MGWMIVKAAGFWCLFLGAAVAMGALRDRWLAPRLGERAAHQAETLLYCAVLFLLIALAVKLLAPSAGQAAGLGALWTAMVVAFEFLFFHYVAKKPWRTLLADYNIFAGRLWVLVLLTTAAGPPLARALWAALEKKS